MQHPTTIECSPYRCTIKFWGDSDTRISGIPPNVNLLTTRSTPLTRSQRRWLIGLFDPFEFVYTIGTCSGKFLAHATSRFPQGDAMREFPLYLQNLWKCRWRIFGKYPTPGVSNDRPCNIPQQLYSAYRCTIKFWGDSDTRISGIPPNADLLTTRGLPH